MSNEEEKKGTLVDFEGNTPALLSALNKKFEDKFKDMNLILSAVVLVLVVAVITLILMTAFMLIETFRFNSVTYREYSEKLDSIETLRETNESLMTENSEVIKTLTTQLKHILDLLIEIRASSNP